MTNPAKSKAAKRVDLETWAREHGLTSEKQRNWLLTCGLPVFRILNDRDEFLRYEVDPTVATDFLAYAQRRFGGGEQRPEGSFRQR